MTCMLIIGASDAGISAALRIKQLDAQAQVTLAAADAYPNFSICGLPFYLSGEVADWRTLAHRTIQEIESHGIHLLLDHRAEKIDAQAKIVQMTAPNGEVKAVPYDRLLIGRAPNRPGRPSRVWTLPASSSCVGWPTALP